MKVRALRMGYYGLMRRRPGAVFDLKDPKDFAKSWMVQVGGESESKRRGKPVAAKPVDDVPETPAAATEAAETSSEETPSGESDVI